MNAAFLNLTIVTIPNRQILVSKAIIEIKKYFYLQIPAMIISD